MLHCRKSIADLQSYNPQPFSQRILSGEKRFSPCQSLRRIFSFARKDERLNVIDMCGVVVRSPGEDLFVVSSGFSWFVLLEVVFRKCPVYFDIFLTERQSLLQRIGGFGDFPHAGPSSPFLEPSLCIFGISLNCTFRIFQGLRVVPNFVIAFGKEKQGMLIVGLHFKHSFECSLGSVVSPQSGKRAGAVRKKSGRREPTALSRCGCFNSFGMQSAFEK